ncbi:MAG: hypothetical protein IKL88_07260, partial [Erysipelotrichales bacterium]|nr:hypothetical protein [Erysipelotrichales bacterium]
IEDGIESEAVQELLDTLNSISARQRVFFPFERISVYRTGYDTLSIMFEANGERIDASMMKDFSTLYDSGTSPYKAYVVGIESFEKIASVIEKYGEVESK